MYEGEVVATLHDFPPSVQGALSIVDTPHG